ncbi:fibronectin type III domain-containing protein [Chiayiivirga flava]|uniref:Fibronectin type-III domain-containing protein n=1 Tax=Chiayiivirga flava TaxID=659595 RepID=A0A7W8D6I6_9GAMM|nr:fibronectin type III domain-containing protein [Chiayiivirga flava]MBB5208810.1 hypothetical protein [Chiayiivirga flava]
MLLLAFAATAASGPGQAQSQPIPVWYDLQTQGDIAYLLRKSPAQIMRYDLATRQWLAPIPLAEIPSAFVVTGSHLFVASGRKVERMTLTGGGLTHVQNTASDIISLHVDGALLFVNATSDYYARVMSVNIGTLQRIDEIENYIDSLHGASISTSANRLFGRSQGVSPSDITYVEYDNTGNFVAGGASPYHGDYPGASKTWTFPDGDRVVDDSGTVYHANDLTYANSLARSLDDLAFHGSDIPIGLDDDMLVAYSNTLLETGRHTLQRAARDIVVRGANVFAFHEDASQATKVGVEIVPLAALTPNEPGQPISPLGLAYSVDDAAIDGDGVIYLLSKAHHSVFRWDMTTQTYLGSIALPEAASIIEYAPALDRLYVGAASRTIYRVDLANAGSTAVPHVVTPQSVDTLIAMDNDLLALNNGSWEDQWLYGPSGALLLTPLGCCYDRYHFYDDARNLLYVGGSRRSYLGNGVLGAPEDNNYYFNGEFIALSHNGQLLVDGNGLIYSSATFETIDALSNDIVRAHWNAQGVLFTVREPEYVGSGWEPEYASPTTIQKWSPYYAVERSLVVEGAYEDMFVRGNRAVLITSVDGMPSFSVLDAAFGIVAPAVLQPPVLRLDRASLTAVALAWSDVSGENGYVVERQRGGGAWSQVGVAGANELGHMDRAIDDVGTFRYRVRARNGAQSSAWSNVVEVELEGLGNVGVAPLTVDVRADDAVLAEDGRLFLLSRQHETLFVWSTPHQRWDASIGLQGAPSSMAYSPRNAAVYLQYANGSVGVVSLAADAPVEGAFPFETAESGCGIAVAGEYLVVCAVHPDGYYSQFISIDAAGRAIERVDSGDALHAPAWSASSGRLYYLERVSNPAYIAWHAIAEDGSFEAHGGDYVGGVQAPLRVSPGGDAMVTGNGDVYATSGFERVGTLPSGVVDATWRGAELLTLADERVLSHPDFSSEVERVWLDDLGQRIFVSRSGQLIVLTEIDGIRTSVQRYDAALQPVPEPVLSDGFE